ncbi:PfkB family carbohydrate kinase [Actinomadura madurae]|uniref:PfkB family carbohydrate kinase n=1 Tax=Actinomadura madurae TaxID=1993 RepID=UPI0020D21BC4|nr:PfkB family carbohydrate kinase [Actinomadura madurae]MCP9947504.1 PfkB family carbohydrate kinase [Actinomadura madurae]
MTQQTAPGRAPEPSLADPCAERERRGSGCAPRGAPGAGRVPVRPGLHGHDLHRAAGAAAAGHRDRHRRARLRARRRRQHRRRDERLGLRVGLAAPFGDDMFGAYLWRTLAEQEGVDLGLSRRVRGWSTPVTVSMAYDSDRSMVTFARPVPSPLDDLGAPPPGRAGLLRGRRPAGAGVGRPDARARRAGLRRPRLGPDRRLAGRGPRPARARGRVPAERRRGDVLHPHPHPGGRGRALAARVPVVVVKCGGDGAIAIDSRSGERAETSALPVEALDPTGAGDVFAAGFVFATLAGLPLAERLRFANLCAGLSVRHRSGSLGSPCWGEIAAFGESGEVPEAVLADYAFVVPFIPDAADDSPVRAEPTLRPQH